MARLPAERLNVPETLTIYDDPNDYERCNALNWATHRRDVERVGSRFLPKSELDGEALLGRPPVTDPPRWHTRPPEVPGGPWLTKNEFARRVGRSSSVVRRWIATGRVEAVTAYQGKTAWVLVHERDVERIKRELARTQSERLERPAGGPWLTASETAAELGLQRSTVYRHIDAGLIPAMKFLSGGRERWFISASDVSLIRSTPGRVRPKPGPDGEWLTVSEFASRVGLTPEAVTVRIRLGHVRAYRLAEGRQGVAVADPRGRARGGAPRARARTFRQSKRAACRLRTEIGRPCDCRLIGRLATEPAAGSCAVLKARDSFGPLTMAQLGHACPLLRAVATAREGSP